MADGPSNVDVTGDSKPPGPPKQEKQDPCAKVIQVLDNLQQERELLFSRATTISDNVKRLGEQDFIALKCQYETLLKLEDQFADIQRRIHGQNTSLPSKRRLNTTHSQIAFDNILFQVQTAYFLAKAQVPDPMPTAPPAPTTSNTTSANKLLPRISLPVFSGDLDAWLDFLNLYNSLIHENANLTGTEKFQYLKSSLAGESLSIVSGYAVNAANYEEAYRALLNRYSSKRRLASLYLNKILAFKPLSNNNLNSLKSFLTLHHTAISAIKVTEIPDLANFLLFSLALNNLDPKSRKSFEDKYSDQEIPTYSQLIEYVTTQIRTLELHAPSTSTSNSAQPRTTKTMALLVNSQSVNNANNTFTEKKCPLCKERHSLARCASFRKRSIDQKYAFLKSIHHCFNCLGPHVRTNCGSSNVCKRCKSSKHHTLLHNDSSASDFSSALPNTSASPHGSAKVSEASDSHSPPQVNSKGGSSSLSCTHVADTRKPVLLGTARVLIPDRWGNHCVVRALVDPGSQVSVITLSCARLLGFPIKPTSTCLSGIGSTEANCHGVISCSLKSRYSEISIPATPLVLTSISSQLPSATLPDDIYHKFAHLQLADEDFHVSSDVHFLVGADLYPDILAEGSTPSLRGSPSAIKSIFGWLIIGPVLTAPTNSVISLLGTSSVQNQLQKFWETEEVSVPIPPDPLDAYVEHQFQATHSREPDGRYVVALPFRPGAISPPPNKQRSLQSFLNLERRLKCNSDKFEAYQEFMGEYISLHHMSVASSASSYIIPHHCVMKQTGTDTKLRVVFNASDAGQHKVSLNSQLLPGPKLQRDIADVLSSFRFFKVALCADVRMMYRQILVRPEDRIHQHVFYRPSGTSSVIEYQLNTVTYGLTPSAYLAQRCIQQLVQDDGSPYPLASRALIHNIYVDDIISGASNEQEAHDLLIQLQQLMSKGGFELRKWASSHPNVIETLPMDHQQTPMLFAGDHASVKILGLLWEPGPDCFTFKVEPFESKLTKRTLLSYIAGIYDPLGFLAPVTFNMKCVLQQLWLDKADWDSPVSESIARLWAYYQESMSSLSQLNIPRFVGLPQASSTWLAGFCDASERGFSAVLYICHAEHGATVSHLLRAKTKVAPLKTLSIPRLELCGAVLLSKLLSSVRQNNPLLQPLHARLFSDSEIVLHWVATSPHLLKTFVANRVVAILDATSNAFWAHIPSQHNPADYASRGLTPSQFSAPEYLNCWMHGPALLSLPLADWPAQFNPSGSDISELPEIKPVAPSVNVIAAPSGLIEVLNGVSNWRRLQRIFAWVYRFVNRCRTKTKGQPISSALTVDELNQATHSLLFITQRHYFHKEIRLLEQQLPLKGSLRQLNPFLDEQQLLRVGGRLSNAELPQAAKHPVLLPQSAHISLLLCQFYHLKLLHSGPRSVQAIMQQEYWVPGLRKLVRRAIRGCLTCHRFRASSFQPQMADLPSSRVRMSRPFTHTGTDFAGPFSVRSGNPRKPYITKGYLCIFVCFSTKCVHLEFSSELSTNAFLAALDRFVARRGLPSCIYSDQGRNFLGASHHLKEVYQFLSANEDHIGNHLSAQHVQWRFIPVYSPNFGGLWEAGVKSAKLLLTRMMGNSTLTVEEYATLFARVEAVLNSRPLCPLESDPTDATSYLSPGHFLIGAPLVSVPEIPVDNNMSLRNRWIRQRQILQSFWTRWSREYLNTLSQRLKWTSSTALPQPGDVVLMKGINTSPNQWPLARVIQLHHGTDQIPRVATIRLANGQTLTRALSGLVPLVEPLS